MSGIRRVSHERPPRVSPDYKTPAKILKQTRSATGKPASQAAIRRHVPIFIRNLNNREAPQSLRITSACVLGLSGDTRAIKPLTKAGLDPDVKLNRVAGRALNRLVLTRELSKSLSHLKSFDISVRYAALLSVSVLIKEVSFNVSDIRTQLNPLMSDPISLIRQTTKKILESLR